MKIDDQTFERLAYLARLKFTEQEKEIIKSDMEKITGFFRKNQQIRYRKCSSFASGK